MKEDEKNLSDEDKAEIYRRYLSRVSFYKGNKMRTGFLVVSFKNGAEKVYLISSGKNYRRIIEIPSTFQFNKDNGTVSYVASKKSDNLFSLETETRVVDFDGILSMLADNEEWDITADYFPE